MGASIGLLHITLVGDSKPCLSTRPHNRHWGHCYCRILREPCWSSCNLGLASRLSVGPAPTKNCGIMRRLGDPTVCNQRNQQYPRWLPLVVGDPSWSNHSALNAETAPVYNPIYTQYIPQYILYAPYSFHFLLHYPYITLYYPILFQY